MRFGKTTIAALVLLYSSFGFVEGAPPDGIEDIEASNRSASKNGSVQTGVMGKPQKPPKEVPVSSRSTGPEQIGTHNPIVISSDSAASQIMPVVSSDGRRQVYSLKHDGASYMSAHFKNMDLPPSCSLEITDASGDQYVMMRGRGRANLGEFWARHIKGDTMEIVLLCNGKKHEAVFEIDEYVSGYPHEDYPDKPDQQRFLRKSSHLSAEEAENLFPIGHHHSRDLSICTSDDKKNAVCFKNSHPVEYEKARAVARLYINGSGACTGWLVGEENLLMTNQHCIDSLADVLNTDFEFMGEEATCASTSGDCWMCDRGTIFDGSALLKVDAGLDMALVKIEGNPIANYGFLDLDVRTALDGEEIYIPQHPGGRAKEIGLEDQQSTGNVCRVLNSNNGCCSCQDVNGVPVYHDVRYTCDTEGGSSGSPVLARSSHRVIALHHCGGACDGNMGVPVEKFINLVVNDIYPNGLPDFDEDPPNDPPSDCDHQVTIKVLTDRYGEETTWELKDENNRVLATQAVWSTGSLADSTQYEHTVCVAAGELSFTIRDAWGDGICCGYGSGNFELLVDGQRVHQSSGQFLSSETVKIITPGYCKDFRLELLTDNYPSETSWTVKNGSGQTVASGQGYAGRGTIYRQDKCLLVGTGPFTFTISDSYGDGVCCGYGQGSYKVFYDAQLVGSGGQFSSSDSVIFS